jgi:nitrite reductase/ring-hydroxylating ferredoxin subunit
MKDAPTMKLFMRPLIRLLNTLAPKSNAPLDRVRVGSAQSFEQIRMKVVEVDGVSILIARTDAGDLCAVDNQCAHLPVPLDAGNIEGQTIVCAFHNSRYDLYTGENLDWTPGVLGVTVPRWTAQAIALGQAPRNLKAYRVIVENDAVYLTSR